MTTIQTIPLSKLTPSPLNVRHVPTDVAELAASIEAQGLLQNLIVVDHGSSYGVIAGGRRLAALRKLVEIGAWDAHAPIPCQVIEATEATASSIAENSGREPMHPADEFEAFKALVEQGQSVEAVAARYGVTPLVVRRRLKLARVHPNLIAELRAGTADLEQLIALAITDDQKLQLQVWNKASDTWARNPHRLREALTKGKIDSAHDRRLKFVGLDAYEAAGGTVVHDLFSEHGYVTDAELLQRLTDAKLTALEAELGAEGWSFVETHQEHFYDIYRYGTAKPKTVAGEPTWSAAQRKKAGVVVMLNADGTLEIHRGRIKPEDPKAAAKAAKAQAKAQAQAKGEPPTVGLSDTLARQLSAHRTAAIAAELAQAPSLALAVTVHAMLYPILNGPSYGVSAVHMRADDNRANLGLAAPDITASKAIAWLDSERAYWKAVLAEADSATALHRLRLLETPELLRALAFCAGASVNALQSREDCPPMPADRIAAAVQLDMADYWEPTAEGYLGRISREQILATLTEAGVDTKPYLKLKKGPLAEAAEKALAGKRWLPTMLQARPVAPEQD